MCSWLTEDSALSLTYQEDLIQSALAQQDHDEKSELSHDENIKVHYIMSINTRCKVLM